MKYSRGAFRIHAPKVGVTSLLKGLRSDVGNVGGKAEGAPHGDEMAGDTWNEERVRLKPLHRRIEARCREIALKKGRTWRRLTIQDRERFLCEALRGMEPSDVYRWSTRYSIGDILNAVIMPERGQAITERPGRAGRED